MEEDVRMTTRRYRVKEQYIDFWYDCFTSDEIAAAQEVGMTMADIELLASDWDIPVDELMAEVEEVLP